MGIHLLHYVHGNNHTRTYDVICDSFVAIAQDAGFHVGWKQLHVLPSNMFNSFRQWINIVFIKDGIHTLVNIVIANLTQAYLFP
jgi:hypothetical protein